MDGEEGEIFELVVEDAYAEGLEELLMAALDAAKQTSIDLVGGTGLQQRERRLCDRLGFKPQRDDRYAVYLRCDELSESARTDDESCYVTAGDGDAMYGSSLLRRAIL